MPRAPRGAVPTCFPRPARGRHGVAEAEVVHLILGTEDRERGGLQLVTQVLPPRIPRGAISREHRLVDGGSRQARRPQEVRPVRRHLRGGGSVRGSRERGGSTASLRAALHGAPRHLAPRGARPRRPPHVSHYGYITFQVAHLEMQNGVDRCGRVQRVDRLRVDVLVSVAHAEVLGRDEVGVRGRSCRVARLEDNAARAG